MSEFPLLIDWSAETQEELGAAFDAAVRDMESEGIGVGGEGGFPASPVDGLQSVVTLMAWAWACGLLGVGRGVGVQVHRRNERAV